MRSCATLFFIFALTIMSPARQVRCDDVPLAAPPYYRVHYQASDEPGGLIFPVTDTVWVPPGVTNIRGVIVHQHGCGEGSCRSGLTGAYDPYLQHRAPATSRADRHPPRGVLKRGIVPKLDEATRDVILNIGGHGDEWAGIGSLQASGNDSEHDSNT
jgi:hypothetical protein